jgi:hypothetical protein
VARWRALPAYAPTQQRVSCSGLSQAVMVSFSVRFHVSRG